MAHNPLRKAAFAAALLAGTAVQSADAGQALLHQAGVPQVIVAAPAAPDLTIHSYQFVPTSDKGLRVKVQNAGFGKAGRTVLRLTVRRIDGTPVGRSLERVLLPIAPGGALWVALDTSAILPKSVSLADTTFRIDADAGQHVAESNETNNQAWHNL